MDQENNMATVDPRNHQLLSYFTQAIEATLATRPESDGVQSILGCMNAQNSFSFAPFKSSTTADTATEETSLGRSL
jgi:hypothetical protein